MRGSGRLPSPMRLRELPRQIRKQTAWLIHGDLHPQHITIDTLVRKMIRQPHDSRQGIIEDSISPSVNSGNANRHGKIRRQATDADGGINANTHSPIIMCFGAMQKKYLLKSMSVPISARNGISIPIQTSILTYTQFFVRHRCTIL